MVAPPLLSEPIVLPAKDGLPAKFASTSVLMWFGKYSYFKYPVTNGDACTVTVAAELVRVLGNCGIVTTAPFVRHALDIVLRPGHQRNTGGEWLGRSSIR